MVVSCIFTFFISVAGCLIFFIIELCRWEPETKKETTAEK